MLSVITTWPACGVEVSRDRDQTWVARAAHHKDYVVVEQLGPVAGTTAVVGLLGGWCKGWQAEAVGIDPTSPSATLVEPLRAARLPVKTTDAHNMAVAHGTFVDLLNAGRLRIRGHSALDQAARQAVERRLAGAQAVDRYQGEDVAPLNSAELAVWALVSAPKYPPAEIF